jgi:hypothetical protein
MASLLIILRQEADQNRLKADGNSGIDRPLDTARYMKAAY